MRERTENRPQKGIETRCGGRGATRPTASAARLRLPISECTRWFNTDAVKGLSLTASLSSDSSAIFIWLRMLFSLTTKRGCASSRVPHDARRGIAAAIEACRLRASSLPHRSPFGLAAQPRHENALRATRKSLPSVVDGTKILRVLSSGQVVVWYDVSIHRLVRSIQPRSALLDGFIHRLVRSIQPRSVFVKSTKGWNVFVSRSAFVTSARAKPEGLARMTSSRPKPPGFEPGDDGSRANRACAMPVRSVRGQGVWGPRPHGRRRPFPASVLRLPQISLIERKAA